ncbi:MAG: Ig-like domain-containing protein [Kofleriaceae bacterium]|nr:Ig-like domain-containing protein [Kofleriaceae bacterium]
MSDLEPTLADFHQPPAPPRRSRVGVWLRRAFAVAVVAASLTCGGDGGSTLKSTTSGVAYWSGGGPVRNATVVAWQMVDGERTFELGRATTDANGRWELTTEGYEHIEYDVVGGSYVEASGGEVTLDSNTILRGIVLDVPIGGTRSGITISPLTDLAVTLGHARRAANKEDTYGASVHKAVERLTNHFGFDPLTTPVASPAAPASSPTAEVKYGLVLAGLSQLARSVAEQQGATTQSINTVVWTRTLGRDAGSAEALFDGVGAAPLFVGASCPPPPGCSVEGPGCYADCRAQSNTLKARIGAQILSFLRTSQNGTTLTRNDVEAWLEEVRVRVDADLFGSDPAEEWDQVGPTITWVTPAADATVAGSIAVEVTATDPLGIASLTVTAETPTPMQLVDTDPAPERFAATFSTVGLPEGALTLTATATDSQENRSDATRAIDINNIAFGTGSGLVYKGRIANASVRIYAFQGGVRGTMLGQGTTTSSGAFENVQIADGYNGPLLVEAGFAGTYPEEAASSTVTLDVNDRLRTVIPSYTDGGAVSSLVISPLTSFATTYLEYLQQTNQGGSTLAERWTTARTAMETHFGVANIYSLTPQAPSEMTTFNAGARYGMIMVGLSETARMASTLGGGDGGTFGSAMNAMRVFRVLDTDLADGCWDGRQGAMQLFFGGTRAVSNQSVRLDLANRIVGYLGDGARNQTPYAGAADVLSQLDVLASGGGNMSPGSCSATGRLNPDAGGAFDQSPPTISITTVPAGPIYGGIVTVNALATDDLATRPSLRFTAPAGTTDVDGDGTDSDASANIDTRMTFPNMEGTITVALESFDDAGNRGTGQIVLTVDNVAPTITFGGVTPDGWYRDPVSPTAVPSDTNLASFTLMLNGTSFMSGTQVSVEGRYVLTATAVDGAGNETSRSVTFYVDRTNPVLAVQPPNPSGTWIRGMLDVTVEATDTMMGFISLPTNIAATVTSSPGTTAPGTTYPSASGGAKRIRNQIDTTAIAGSTVASGSLSIRYDITDASGRMAAPVTIAVMIDNAPPVVMLSPTRNQSGNMIDGFVSEPTATIRGTVSTGGSPTTVSVTLTPGGSVDVTPDGSGNWSHTTGALAQGSYNIAVTARDAAGNTSGTPVGGGFVVDRTPPMLTSDTSGIRDEREDTVTYAMTTNVPHHAHGNTVVPLGGSTMACPSVYKHAYLLDTAPAGTENIANPLAFNWRASDSAVGVNPSSMTYSVTAPGGQVYGPFPLSATMSGTDYNATATLRRNGAQGIAALGVVDQTREGMFTITFAASDRLGNATTLTKCWIHQPIGAPVQATSSGGITVPTEVNNFQALSGFKLENNSPISSLLNATHAGAGLMKIGLHNRTGDKVWWTFSPTLTNATFSKTWTAKHVVTSVSSINTACNFDGGDIYGPPAICTSTYSGTMSGENVASTQFSPMLTVRLFDMTQSPPLEVPTCPSCEPMEFELLPDKPYTAIIGIKHLQQLAFSGISSGYFEGNTLAVPTTRLPTADLTPSGDGYDRYCSAYTETGPVSATCTQRTTVRGVRYAAFLRFAASNVNTAAASAAGATLSFTRTGNQVLGAPNLPTYEWSTSEMPTP